MQGFQADPQSTERPSRNRYPLRGNSVVDDSATSANRRSSLAASGHIVDNDGDAKNTRATINGGPPRIA